MKTNFLSVITLFALLYSNQCHSNILLNSYAISASLLGCYIFYKNPNKNASVFLKSMGKGAVGVPLYLLASLENMFLPAIGGNIAMIATPIFGIKSFDHWTIVSHKRASRDMYRLVDFLFAH